jgi:hypothetical protein
LQKACNPIGCGHAYVVPDIEKASLGLGGLIKILRARHDAEHLVTAYDEIVSFSSRESLVDLFGVAAVRQIIKEYPINVARLAMASILHGATTSSGSPNVDYHFSQLGRSGAADVYKTGIRNLFPTFTKKEAKQAVDLLVGLGFTARGTRITGYTQSSP